jgi:homocysteine S-methyltransferase
VSGPRHRRHLPQLDGGLFLTDGGIETVLIFHDGLDLPLFAAIDLLRSDEGTQALRNYYRPYAKLAAEGGTGFVLESPTWRASPRWARELGYSDEELDGLNRNAIRLMEELREEYERAGAPFVIGTFADTAADMVTAITMTYADEATGLTRAAQAAGIPAVISFTVETDGRLPSGEPLGEAIETVDGETGRGPAYYMINCAHPTHFDSVLDGPWRERIRGLRANASTKSHAELDAAEELDAGDPEDLGRRYAALKDRLPALTVVGGCCGTDHRHLAEISSALRASSS